MQPVIDTNKPHSARMYDYYLGGKDHFAADRETAQQAIESWAAVRTAVRENRAFLGRAVRYLAGEAGIRQFLDIGTGLPSANNVHEVAQAAAPESRIVYVDNDPIVLAHARALLTSTPEGRTAYIDADLREPEKILASPAVGETLDLSRPVALMLVAVLHFLTDADNPARVVATLVDALPPGSYLVASHVTPEHDPEGVGGLERAYRQGGVPAQARPAGDFAALAFRGLEMIDPGVVLVSEWRPQGGGPRPLAAEVSWYGGIGRKADRRPG
jgi:SAM-dependent methyltransferase